MAVNKNFVVKNGLEVDTNLILADATTNKVGIGTSVPNYPLHVFGGIGVTDSYVAGVSTIRNELNVGAGGTIFTVIATEAQDQFVGIRTANPAFLLDVRSPVSTGQTALYIQGDARITGNTNIEGDINIDEVNIRNLNVSGLSTFVGFVTYRESVAIQTNLYVGGISTFVGNINNVGGGATIGNIQIGITDDDKIDTRGNILVLDSAAGQVTVDDRLRVTGIGTFDTNVAIGGTLGVVGFSTFADSVVVQDNFYVGGISTFVGIITTKNDVYVGGNLNIKQNITLDTNLNILGIATLGTLDVNGSSNFDGYIDANDSVDIQNNLNVGGISTFVGFSTFQDSVTIQDNFKVGGISTFVGVASFLSDLRVSGNLSIAQNITLDTNLNILGIATVGTLDVNGNANIDGSLSGKNSVEAVVVTSGLTVAGITTLASSGGITTTGGDLYVGGDLYIKDDLVLDEATTRNLNVTGIATINNLIVNGTTDVYSNDATFHGNVTIDGNVTIGGTSTIINAAQLRVEDKDIILGFTTAQLPTDDTANHGGIAIASTEGTPLVSLAVAGINTLPDTYKQIMWVKRNTMGAGTTDAFLFNYGVGIGSTLVPNGVRFAVSQIQLTDNTINSPQINVSGATTSNSYNIGATQVISSGRQLQNIASLDATTTATIEAAIANAPNTFTDITVTGISTLGVTSATNLTSQQLSVSGIATFQSDVKLGDNDKLYFGDGNDLEIYHNGSNSYIDDAGTGVLYIRSNQTEIQKYTGETIAQFVADSAVNLYYDNALKFQTTTSGITVTGNVSSDGIRLGDNDAAYFGDSNDLQIYHDGSDSYINDVGTGDLIIKGANLTLNSDTININNAANTENLIRAFGNGAVELYYDNSKKFETTGAGVTITGICSASGGFNLGISSAGTSITTGPVTTLNFIGAGNTFAVNGTTVDISIAGGGGGGVTEIKTSGITTTAAVGVGSFATATYRSAAVTAQIVQGTTYQVGRYLMIHDGSTVTVVEQAAVSTGSSMIGSFTGAINGSNAELRVTMVSAGIATVTTKIDTVTV